MQVFVIISSRGWGCRGRGGGIAELHKEGGGGGHVDAYVVPLLAYR